jgi:hypothetical protein
VRALAFAIAFALAPAAQAGDAAARAEWNFPMEAAESVDFIAEGLRQEDVLSADFDDDGREDLAMVLRGGDSEETARRVLLVLFGTKDGYRRVGVGDLDPYPLGEASMSAPKNVLVVEDLTGGTTATQSTYRYRYERKTGRMRLIGDDVSLYSRTHQHGMTTVSTNRLTGKRITTINELVGEGENAVLGADKATTTTVAIEPALYLEDAPTPEETLGLGE